MGKAKKRKTPGASRRKAGQAQKRKSRSNWVLAAVVGVLAAVGIYLLVAYRGEKVVTAESSKNMPGVAKTSGAPYKFRETRPTLSPALFVGDVAQAYQAAKDIPEVLDQLYCYCRCAENFGHKSLLSCYVDKHAST